MFILSSILRYFISIPFNLLIFGQYSYIKKMCVFIYQHYSKKIQEKNVLGINYDATKSKQKTFFSLHSKECRRYTTIYICIFNAWKSLFLYFIFLSTLHIAAAPAHNIFSSTTPWCSGFSCSMLFTTTATNNSKNVVFRILCVGIYLYNI